MEQGKLNKLPPHHLLLLALSIHIFDLISFFMLDPLDAILNIAYNNSTYNDYRLPNTLGIPNSFLGKYS